MKRNLIIGIVLLTISLGLIIYSEFNKTNIYELTNSGSNKENVKVYLDATFVAGSITNDKDNGYYVMFGDGVQYIVYISNNMANKVNRYLLDHEEESYHIEGITKLIPSSMEENGKKFVKEWLDYSHNHNEEEDNHSHDITTDEFYQYFGYVYLDTNIGFDYIKLFTYISSILGLLLIIYFVNTKYHFIG
jgi:hypothetical protein